MTRAQISIHFHERRMHYQSDLCGNSRLLYENINRKSTIIEIESIRERFPLRRKYILSMGLLLWLAQDHIYALIKPGDPHIKALCINRNTLYIRNLTYR